MQWLYIYKLPTSEHWLLFIHKIFVSSTCFEPQVFIFRRIQLYTSSIWYCHSLWEFVVACRYTAWVRTYRRGKVVGRASCIIFLHLYFWFCIIFLHLYFWFCIIFLHLYSWFCIIFLHLYSWFCIIFLHLYFWFCIIFLHLYFWFCIIFLHLYFFILYCIFPV
jgi:hypothetical protein